MKQIIITFAIVTLLSVSFFNANANTIIKENETFTIVTNETNALESDFNKSWNIEYAENTKSIVVYKKTTKIGEEYIVRNEFFEVRYINSEKGFGVKKVKRNLSTVDPAISDNVLNNNELKNQSLLSSSKLNEEKALSYIASFVPHLLNENYKHLLN